VDQQVTADAEYGIGVSLVAIAATFLLLAYQRRVILRTGSVALRPITFITKATFCSIRQ
jgi:ferrous-iron efflux pump FieF